MAQTLIFAGNNHAFQGFYFNLTKRLHLRNR
jgi:hypothetical protein